MDLGPDIRGGGATEAVAPGLAQNWNVTHRHYWGIKKVVGLERGALSLVSTTEELLDRKVAAPV
jgi:hypothetical protein